MKVIYDHETDTLTVIFAEVPVAESDEDKPGMTWNPPSIAFLQKLVSKPIP